MFNHVDLNILILEITLLSSGYELESTFVEAPFI